METNDFIRSVEAQILGRVFTLDNSIHFVLDVDGSTGMARCSRNTPTGPGIVFMPVTEVRLWLTEQTRSRELKPDTDGDAALDDGDPEDDSFEDED